MVANAFRNVAAYTLAIFATLFLMGLGFGIVAVILESITR